jgi:hypothetical protein
VTPQVSHRRGSGALGNARRRGILVAALGTATLLSGCGIGSAQAPITNTVVVTVPPPQSTAATTSNASQSATPGPVIDASGHDFTAWASPTGNIVCAATIDAGAVSIRCDVLVQTWKLPPKPATCDFDWGHGTYLDRGKSGLGCVSDALVGTDAVGSPATWWNGQPGAAQITPAGRPASVALAYGASMRIGSITCVSQTDGMHCTDATSGAGFDINRDTYVLR